MGLCLGITCKLSLSSQRLPKNVNAEPSTRDDIEAVRLGALPLQARPLIDTASSFFL
jgi:hypothetical protein